MKKLLFAALMTLTMSAAFASNGEPKVATVQTQSEASMGEGAISKAIGAIKSSCPNAQGNLNYSVETAGACFVDGFITKVHFWTTPNCPPNQYCIQIVEIVGTVTLGCNNEVISVECGLVSI